MKGLELKEIVRNSGVKLKEIIEGSGIPQRTLYNLYNKEIVERHYLRDLAKVLPNMPKGAFEPEPDFKEASSEDLASLAHKLLSRIDKSMIFHERHITDLERNNDAHIEANRAFIKSNDAFIDTSRIMSKIVDLCLDAGALTVDRSKIVDLLSKK